MKEFKPTFIIAYSSISVAVIVLLYIAVGRPVFRFSDDMRKRFLSLQVKLEEAETLIRSLPNPQRSLEEIERRHAEFREISGSGRQLPKIIQILGQSTAGKPITVVAIRPKEDIKPRGEILPSGVEKIFVEMTINGGYQDIGDYLNVLCNLPGGFTIESMSIDRIDAETSRTGQKTGALDANLVISTYIVGDQV